MPFPFTVLSARRGIALLSGVVLASVTLTGVGVSVASASEPPPARDGPAVDEDGNTVLESVERARASTSCSSSDGADVDEVVADVAADGVEVTGTLEGAIDVFTAPLDADDGGRAARPGRRGAGRARAASTS